MTFAALLLQALALTLAPVPASLPAPGGLTLAQGSGQEVAAGQSATLRGLDKIAGTTRDFELRPGEVATFGRLTITLTECRQPAGDAGADAFAHLVIHDSLREREVFRGWMIASSPALNALDHPRFDVWLIRCSSV